MKRRSRIAIIGAGLGGATAAALLQREAFQVPLERAPSQNTETVNAEQFKPCKEIVPNSQLGETRGPTDAP